jgi:DNA-directed RNA polymerase specialized sigma24 family protein
LLYAGFGSLIFGSGYDPEEVLQEVYRGILARNAGRCAFDPRKASFGHYVHMVCSCVLRNWHRREARYRSMEKTGLPTFGECGERTTDDVAVVAADRASACDSVYRGEESAADDLTAFIVSEGPSGDTMLALTLLPHVREGLGRAEISVRTGLSKPAVSRGLTYLREVTRRWLAGRR